MTLSRPISEPQLSDPVHPPSTHQRCHRGSIFRNSSISFLSPDLLSLSVHSPPASALLPLYRHYRHPPVSLSLLLSFFTLHLSLPLCIFNHNETEAEALLRLVILRGERRAAPCYEIYLLIRLLITLIRHFGFCRRGRRM